MLAPGKLIGGFCALSGVFILTLPIPIVVNSFASFYKNRLWRTEVVAAWVLLCERVDLKRSIWENICNWIFQMINMT